MSEYEKIIKSGLPLRNDFDNVIEGWKIYYNDGFIYSSRDGNWLQAPSSNIAIVLIFYRQTYPIHDNGVNDIYNYRELLDEGKYFWHRLMDGVSTFGQCEATDLSMPLNPILGEIKIWNGGSNFQQIYNQAYLDNKW